MHLLIVAHLLGQFETSCHPYFPSDHQQQTLNTSKVKIVQMGLRKAAVWPCSRAESHGLLLPPPSFPYFYVGKKNGGLGKSTRIKE
jgi:hypothetical protein